MVFTLLALYLLASWGILLAGTEGLNTYDGIHNVGYALIWPVLVVMATYMLIEEGRP
jgi:hypothetical protein